MPSNRRNLITLFLSIGNPNVAATHNNQTNNDLENISANCDGSNANPNVEDVQTNGSGSNNQFFSNDSETQVALSRSYSTNQTAESVHETTKVQRNHDRQIIPAKISCRRNTEPVRQRKPTEHFNFREKCCILCSKMFITSANLDVCETCLIKMGM